MANFQIVPNKVVGLTLALILGLSLSAFAQQKKMPAVDSKNAPAKTIQSIQPQIKTTEALAVKASVPGVIGQTQTDAAKVLVKAGFRMGMVQHTSIGKGRPGTVVKQSPGAKVLATKGSAVNIWILTNKGGVGLQRTGQPDGSQGQPQPRFQASNKKLIMTFPDTVPGVIVYDSKGQVLQTFGRGRQFDITESLRKTNGGNIYLGITPKPGPTAVPMRWDPRDRIPYNLGHYRDLTHARIIPTDDRTMADSEPGNDTIGGAARLGVGYVNGEVGGDDATDFGRVTALAAGTGTLVRVEVVSGSVELYLYGPTRTYLDGGDRSVWIALAPSTNFFFEVQPTGSTSTTYRIRISKRQLNDAYEVNDSHAQAKTFSTGRAFLGNVINSSGAHVGFNDFYKIRIDEPKNVRINVSNAGLASGKRVTVSLFDPNGTLVSSEYSAGNANGCIFNHDLRPDWDDPSYPVPFPAGDWRILVSEYSSNTSGIGSPAAYGLGVPPVAYTGTDHWMTTTLTP
jgi:PASTA domain